MQPEIHLGPITLQTFGIMFALGFIAAGVVIAKRLKEWGKPPDWAYEMVFAALLGGVVGGAAAVLAWGWRRGFFGLALLDFAAPLIALGYAVGRVGCKLSGDGDYGEPSDLPWAMAYPDGTEPIDVEVHPTPIYETLAMGLIALALWRLRDRLRPGLVFALWLLLSGLERLLVEFIRRNDTVAIGLTWPQLVSVAMMGAGVIWLVRARQVGDSSKFP